jgi:hypothetical protein
VWFVFFVVIHRTAGVVCTSSALRMADGNLGKIWRFASLRTTGSTVLF